MHTKLPFAAALILVLAPSAVSLLLWVVADSHFKRVNSKEREDPLECIPSIQPCRQDIGSVLIVLGIGSLAVTAIGAS
jgi:hypothetical protein